MDSGATGKITCIFHIWELDNEKGYSMLIIQKQAEGAEIYNIDKICDRDKAIFFDIETTGFSRKYNIIYLIGCMYYENDEVHFTQYLAESPDEEAIVLQEFYKKLSSFDTIIHFNGASFDMPFVSERGQKYNIDFQFETYKSVDLYKLIKPYGNMLKLENLKQKSVEKLIGIKRKDPFSGGELITVYNEYVISKNPHLLNALIMHNIEDVFYMGNLTSLISFTELMSGNFDVTDFTFSEFKDVNGNPSKELQISLHIDSPLPFLLSYNKDGVYISGRNNSIHLSVKLLTGELKYFFENYKDYYYLPEEDVAIHKSVSSYVDKNHRRNATAATCYVKKSGEFLPVFGSTTGNLGELFKTDYKEKVNWISADKINDDNMDLYVKILLKYFSY